MNTISDDWLRWAYREIRDGRVPQAASDDEQFYINRIVGWVEDDTSDEKKRKEKK